MIPAKPEPCVFKLRGGGSLLDIFGWRSTYTLGIYQENCGTYASAMLMSGLTLAEGFETVDAAHRFNKLVMESKMFTGTPFLEEIHARGGGKAECEKLVQKLKAKAEKEAKNA